MDGKLRGVPQGHTFIQIICNSGFDILRPSDSDTYIIGLGHHDIGSAGIRQ